ncbi:MAG TPA: hypothetical protein VMI31_09900 [Fimbriimonadaceae bacterium]|nr:hypothetical protein [Fimbriimonadaceae bacterium]
MPTVERRSDVVEEHSENVVRYGGGGLLLFLVALVLWFFNYNYQGSLLLFSYVLGVISLALMGYGAKRALDIRKVQAFSYSCPYCKAKNRLSAEPETDFTCIECHRLIPVLDKQVLPVQRVLCGYCREPNYYSDKTIVLLCESCNHEIPITRGDGSVAHSKFAIQEDTSTYELSLTGYEHATEDLVTCLQQMLALNRNQVKDMLTDLPCVLLTGIPKKKAEMLAAQLAVHHAAASYRPI